METPSRAAFETMAGRDFAVAGGDARLWLRRVDPLPSSPRDGGGFRLEFVGPATLAQGTFLLECGDQRFELFIVPIARDGASLVFEAIFN